MAHAPPPSSPPALHPGWASLPADILHVILDKLVSVSDYVRFTSVCSHWNAVSAANKQYWRLRSNNSTTSSSSSNPNLDLPTSSSSSTPYSSSYRLPLLLVPTVDGSQDTRSFYNVPRDTLLPGLRLHLPAPYTDKRCCGSSHGWLAISHKMDDGVLAITLLQPFSGATIRLPEIVEPDSYADDFDDAYKVGKVVLSADPGLSPDGGFEVVAIYGGMSRLALYRSGDKDWIQVPKKARIPTTRTMRTTEEDGNTKTRRSLLRAWVQQAVPPWVRQPVCTDVIRYRGQFCAMTNYGWLVSIWVVANRGGRAYLRLTTIVVPVEESYSTNTYIVESTPTTTTKGGGGGDLLLVRRMGCKEEGEEGFNVFKLMDSSGPVYDHPEEVKSIGGGGCRVRGGQHFRRASGVLIPGLQAQLHLLR